jgi:RimJ/RimL family protein N-acetyltransferase
MPLDIPEILSMIKELADYENEPDKVLATESSLEKTLVFATSSTATSSSPQFENASGYAKTLILRAPSTSGSSAVAGMALYFPTYSTWRSAPGIHLEDLFVRPAYRKKGYGKLLIQALAQEVKKMEGGRLEWNCLKWNEPSLQFYRSLGAEELVEWVQLRVDGENLEKLAGKGK